MDDSQIHERIEQLVAEEHELWERESAGAAGESDRRRLKELEVSLDQRWDLLRQRRRCGRPVAIRTPLSEADRRRRGLRARVFLTL